MKKVIIPVILSILIMLFLWFVFYTEGMRKIEERKKVESNFRIFTDEDIN